MKKIGILGGGLTGLVIGAFLKSPYKIFEKEKKPGGLCRTFVKDGYTWDFGGAHILFSKNQKVIDFEKKILGRNLKLQKRNNKIFYQGRFLKYPFENGLNGLSVEENYECLTSYLFNQFTKKPKNLEEWFYYTFGRAMSDKYLLPYNRKIWNMDLKNMSMDWVERIPKPPASDIIKSSLGIETEGYKHQLYFYYPQVGGVEALIKAVLKLNKGEVKTDCEIKSVARSNHGWVVNLPKTTEEFTTLVSTIPLNELIFLLKNIKIPQKVIDSARSLKYNSEINVFLGLNTPNLNNYTALYLPDKDFLPNRVSFPPNFSAKTVPSGCFSCTAEIILSPDSTELLWSEQKIIRHVVSGLEKRSIIKPKSVIYSKMVKTNYAYVVYDKNYAKNMKILREYLRSIKIFHAGRFGDFKYINTDVCIEEGQKMASFLNSSS